MLTAGKEHFDEFIVMAVLLLIGYQQRCESHKLVLQFVHKCSLQVFVKVVHSQGYCLSLHHHFRRDAK